MNPQNLEVERILKRANIFLKTPQIFMFSCRLRGNPTQENMKINIYTRTRKAYEISLKDGLPEERTMLLLLLLLAGDAQ